MQGAGVIICLFLASFILFRWLVVVGCRLKSEHLPLFEAWSLEFGVPMDGRMSSLFKVSVKNMNV